jgi:hypothetical protein
LAAADGAMRGCFLDEIGNCHGDDEHGAGQDDPPAMVSPPDDGPGLLSEFVEAKRELQCALDNVDDKVAAVLDVVRLSSDPVAVAMESNYAWLRSNASLLGMQCTSSSRCPVCLVNQVTRFNDPCGHTLCTTCMDRSNDECYICRAPVRHRRRLFGCH